MGETDLGAPSRRRYRISYRCEPSRERQDKGPSLTASESQSRTPLQSPSRRLGNDEYRAMGEFRRTLREFLAFSEQGTLEQGITSQQHQALLAIKSHPGPGAITIGELAESLLIKNHSAVGLVARLVERDLVARTESAEDRRRVLIELRPRGADILETISLRNLARLNRSAAILSRILRTVRRLEKRGIWTQDH